MAALICALAAEVAACGVRQNAPGPASARGCGPGTFPAPYTRVDSCSAPEVLLTAATAVFSAHPAVQDPQDALESAAALIEPGYLRALGDSAVTLWPVTGAQWAQWATADVRVLGRARFGAEDPPADTASSISRVLVVTEHPSSGADLTPFPVHMRVARTEPGGPWLVDLIEVLA